MINITNNAMTILEARYLLKDEQGIVIETPEQMFRRVAGSVSRGDSDNAESYFNVMSEMDFLPNTPTLINAGKPNGQLSACFVLPIEDSMNGIFDAVKNAAIIHKTGGGTGFSFSQIRPKGSRVATTGGVASGPISFMKVFDAATESVKQGGVRRGANMAMLRIDHPDIEEFIMCKDNQKELNNFNISVAVTDEFMAAVTMDLDFALVDPHTKQETAIVKARDLWDRIIHQAWKNGEPGMIFIDTVNASNPTPEYGDFEATNPCGEQPLLPYESCNLGSINLSNVVYPNTNSEYPTSVEFEIDYDKLSGVVNTAVDFLNDVIDSNCYPLPQITEATLRTRKIGLGVMGFADMLVKLGIRYNSINAVKVARLVMSHIKKTGWERVKQKGYKNTTVTTVAPTGTISMIANASSGIEPNFSWVYKRISCDKELYVVHPLMEAKLKELGQFNNHILGLLERGVRVIDIPELRTLGDFWQISKEISPSSHIAIQAAFQEFTDNAVSKTINLPDTATEKDVEVAYKTAHYIGCKGVTVYRDGSRTGQVLNFEKDGESVDASDSISDIGVRDDLCICGGKMDRSEGCAVCRSCGNSLCSI